jgi:ankyrin repeat protein
MPLQAPNTKMTVVTKHTNVALQLDPHGHVSSVGDGQTKSRPKGQRVVELIMAYGGTPLHVACEKGSIEAIVCLVCLLPYTSVDVAL